MSNIKNTRVIALLSALELPETIQGVQKLLDRCIKKNHTCRIRYVRKELNSMNAIEKKLKALGDVKILPVVPIETPDKPSDEQVKKEVMSLDKLMMRSFDGDGATGKELYQCYVDGLTAKQITEISGSKAPWVKAAKYAKANDLEYPCK